MCAPPDEEFAERLAAVGVPLVPVGQPWGPMTTGAVTGATPVPAADLPRRAAALMAALFGAAFNTPPGVDRPVTTTRSRRAHPCPQLISTST